MKKVLPILLSLTLSSSLFAQDQRMTPEFLWSLGRVSMQDVSPDGKEVLYSVTYYDIDENKGSRDLYTVATSGKNADQPRRLTTTPQNEGDAKYRPDGKKIGYLLGGYMWEMNPDGSGAKQVSDFQMNSFKYSPAGNAILYINDVKYDQTTQDMYPDLPKADARIIDDLMYRHWDTWHDYKYSNIFFTKYQDGKVSGIGQNIMNEAFDSPLSPFGGMEQINFSPDGRHIVYTCKKLKGREYAVSTNSDIYMYDTKSTQTTNLTKGMEGYDMEAVFSPDGKYMAWNSMETPGYEADRNRIFVLNMQTKEKMEITAGFDQNANHPQWKGNDRLYFTSSIDGTQQIYTIDLVNKKPSAVTRGTHNYYGFVATDKFIVAGRTTMSKPMELYRIDYKKPKVTPLTAVNKDKLATVKMGEVKRRTVKTTDGKDMLVWMIYPPNFDETKKYPALLYCQGGPQSQVSQFWSYRWNFQMMAANDYIIVAPNRRGLPGFGTEWNAQISQDWGGQAQRDLLSAIDDAKTEPYIDENRLGSVGASYGGYSVYWLAGNHDKRFKTFISHCGLYNLKSWYGTTEETFFANHDIGGSYYDPQKMPESYARYSPHHFAQNWDTPILVIHGERDFRVPIGQGMEAFSAAQLQGIPSRFLYFPDESHWVLTPQNGILWQRVFFDWLDRSLKE